MSYIVRNCPAYDKDEKLGYTCTLLTVEVAECEDCTDCLIKQVIENCKKECDPTNDDWCRVKENLSKEILQLFDIEECEK